MDDELDDKALDDRIQAYADANAEAPPEQPLENLTDPEPEGEEKGVIEDPTSLSDKEVPEPDVKEEDEVQKRIDRLYFESREAKREAKRLAAENEVLKGNRTENRDETITREAQELAKQEVAWAVFNDKCNKIGDQLTKEYGSAAPGILNAFKDAFPEASGVPLPILEALIDASDGHGHKVLHYLSKNLDIAEQLMTKNARQQGAEVARIVSKLTAPKPVSKAPPPIKPVAGSAAFGTASPTKDWDKMSKAEQIEMFDAQDRKAYSKKWDH